MCVKFDIIEQHFASENNIPQIKIIIILMTDNKWYFRSHFKNVHCAQNTNCLSLTNQSYVWVYIIYIIGYIKYNKCESTHRIGLMFTPKIFFGAIPTKTKR